MRSYREQLYVPASYWLLSVPVVALLGAELFVGFSTIVAVLVYAVFVAAVGGFLLAWSATRIEVTDTVLKAGGDTLPLSRVTEVLPLDDKQAAVLRGPRADPSAVLLLRPYLKKAVYIGLADAPDGVPYWLVASRRPDQLAAAIAGPGLAGGEPAGQARRGVGHGHGMMPPESDAPGEPASTGTRSSDGESAG
jgi:hypothetical protein